MRVLKMLLALAALVATSVSTPAFAQLGFKQVEPELRTRTLFIPFYIGDSPTFASADDPGENGMVAEGTFAATITATIGVPVYPTRLSITLQDGNADDTLACTSIVVTGRNARGQYVRESSTLSESEYKTNHAFEYVSLVKATGCTGSTSADTNDFLSVMMTDEIGLGVDVGKEAFGQVMSICLFEREAGGSGLEITNAEAECVAVNSTGIGTDVVDETYDVLLLETLDGDAPTGLGWSFDAGDAIQIRIRAPINH